MKSLGERIKFARQSNGYTQSELAKLVSVSVNTIARWEHNKTSPSADDIIKLARVLETDLVTENPEGNLEDNSHYRDMQLEDIRLELVSVKEVKKQMTKK